MQKSYRLPFIVSYLKEYYLKMIMLINWLFFRNMIYSSTLIYTFEICNTYLLFQTATDLRKKCYNFISRVNSCSSFFLCQFPEKVSQKGVFLRKKSCQNSSRNSCVFFTYFWCWIINNPQPTMKTWFLQNTFIG